MITIHHHHFSVTVGIDRVIGEADLVSLARSVYDEICRAVNKMDYISSRFRLDVLGTEDVESRNGYRCSG